MSTSIDQSFVKDYNADFVHAFQRMGSFLKPTVRIKDGVVGYTTTFQRIGTGEATTKARHGVITPMNQDHTPITCTLQDFYAGDWVDKLDELKIKHDERRAVAEGGAFALGRKIDSQIITALDGTAQTPVSWTVTSAAAVRNSLLDMVTALNSNDVPDNGQRYGLLTPKAWAMAMTVREFSSADYVGANGLPFTQGAAMHGRFKSWMNVLWMQHSGLPGKGTNAAKVFLYYKPAVGYAVGQDILADIAWHNDRAAHFINHMMSGGAVLIDDVGVIEGNLDDTAAIPVS